MALKANFQYLINSFLSKKNVPREKIIIPWEEALRENQQEWRQAVDSAYGPRILIATSFGGQETNTYVEGLLAMALTLRGARIHFLLCYKYLPACQLATTTHFRSSDEFPRFGPQRSICDSCFYKGNEIYKPLGLPIHLFSHFVEKREEELAFESVK